jgi:hypothetical protein
LQEPLWTDARPACKQSLKMVLAQPNVC